MSQTEWRTQIPEQARRDFLRVLGPWASATLELRRRGLMSPTLDVCGTTMARRGSTAAQERRAA